MIAWETFVSQAPSLIQESYADHEDRSRDWCELPALEGLVSSFWYNKREARAQWEAPPPTEA